MDKRKYTSQHDNEVRIDFANSIRNYLSDIENRIVEERNNPQSSVDKIGLISMQVCVNEFLSWLDDNTIKEQDTVDIKQDTVDIKISHRLLRNQMIIMTTLRNLISNENIQGLLDDNIKPTAEMLQELK